MTELWSIIYKVKEIEWINLLVEGWGEVAFTWTSETSDYFVLKQRGRASPLVK